MFLESLQFTAGSLTKLPKFPIAPMLKEIRFSYQPLKEIAPFAFTSLPNLESLDLAGNFVDQPLTLLDPDALAFVSSNFQKLDMSYFESLQFIQPNFSRSIQPYTCLKFLNGNISNKSI